MKFCINLLIGSCLIFSLALSANAQGIDALRPLLAREANGFEFGLIRLENWLTRIQTSVPSNLLQSGSFNFRPVFFDFSSINLRIGVIASDSTQVNVTNEECAKFVNALRGVMKGPEGGVESAGVKSMVGFAFLPAAPSEVQRAFVSAARFIEQSTFIEVTLEAAQKKTSCEGNLFQEQVIFFQ
jgi:hypothetical protein